MTMEKKPLFIIILLILLAGGGIVVHRKIQYRKTMKALTSIDPQHVILFRIYPRVIRPAGPPIQFKGYEPVIHEFFQSLTDIRSYSPSHDTVNSWDHSWFLEIIAEDVMIQIACHIPSSGGDIVAGQIGRFREGSVTPYGSFQSRKLFQWYQKYKDRWLKPPAAQEGTEGTTKNTKGTKAEDKKMRRAEDEKSRR